jgi:cell division FtsZ-interacting protein ZapD
MGIFPIKCDVCNEHFVPCHSKVHCKELEKDRESYQQTVAEQSQLLTDIIEAFRNNDKLDDAILAAAYHMGHSVSSKEFIWLDEELKRLTNKKKK